MDEHEPAKAEGRAPDRPRPRRLGVIEAAKAGGSVGKASTLGDLTYERTGSVKASVPVLTYVAWWGAFKERNGREPKTDREIINEFGLPSSTFDRYKARWRRAFPEYDTPAVLWEKAKEQGTSSTPDVAAVQLGAVEL